MSSILNDLVNLSHNIAREERHLAILGEGNTSAAPFPSALFYLGPKQITFHRNFSDLGDIYTRIIDHGTSVAQATLIDFYTKETP